MSSSAFTFLAVVEANRKILFVHVTKQLFDFTSFTTVVGDNITIMKTTFELNFDFYQAFNSMNTQYGNKEKLSI